MQIFITACAVEARTAAPQKNKSWSQTMAFKQLIAVRLPAAGCGDQIRKLTVAPRALHGSSHSWRGFAPFKTSCSRLSLVRRRPTRMQAEPAQVHPGLPQQTPPKPQPHCQPPCSSTEGSRRRDLLLMTGSVLAGWITGIRPTSELQAFAAEGITTVFVAGATGNTGRRVVQQLRQAGLSVRAGVRSTEKAMALGFGADPGIKIVEADVTKGIDTLVAAIGDAQAVVCATGAAGFGPNGASQVDEQGTINLVDAALRSASAGSGGVRKFVLVSSLLTNAAAVGQATNPNYLLLNLFGGVLICKLKAEKYLRSSGLNYTIIRPGGLSNEPESVVGNLIVAPEDSLFALDRDPGRVISRDTVAAVAVQAILKLEASRDKVLEVVASPTASQIAPELWFGPA
ncbi:hypothetical protein Vretimale_1887 [Volvox reticuliferus]|uniref:Uncharacterized protein n=1 Tax=Volvox reticuliferus TaxID=1737510 RepID=A0A8J4D5D7_9CHLO|nr:hypothetical protein Vretifemale_17379 [Volvox reticuliferus]GIL95967.1 hypothetical protein Vretimale_1887 [Volvox reticuliferus]